MQARAQVTDWLHCRAGRMNRTYHTKLTLEFDTHSLPAYCKKATVPRGFAFKLPARFARGKF
jgi:hypothetical protein